MTEDERELARLLRSVRDTSGLADGFSIDELRTAGLLEPADFSPDWTIRGVERAESKLAQGLRQIELDLASGRLFEPDYRSRTETQLLSAYAAETGAWDANLRDHVKLVQNAIDVVDAQLQNPRMTWPAAKQTEAEQAFASARRALAAYSLRELEPQLVAVLNGAREAVVDGWREALLERARNGESDEAGARWLERLSEALATDPQLQRLRNTLSKRLARYEGAVKRVSELTHDRHVAHMRAGMQRSGNYAPLGGPGPAGGVVVHQMREL